LRCNECFVEAILLEAVLALEEGDLDEAKRKAHRAMNLEPELIHGETALPEEVVVQRLIASSDETDVSLLIRLGETYAQDGHPADAAIAFRRALERSPERADIRCRLAQGHLAMGEPFEAARELLNAARLNHASAEIQYQLGRAYQAAGAAVDAVEAFRRARHLNPEHAGVLAELRNGGYLN
jgi:predicted Zn-dependent protease